MRKNGYVTGCSAGDTVPYVICCEQVFFVPLYLSSSETVHKWSPSLTPQLNISATSFFPPTAGGRIKYLYRDFSESKTS